MKKRTKEEMRLYRRVLRARGKLVTPIPKTVTPASAVPNVTPVTPQTITDNVTPMVKVVTPCSGCLERDLQIKKLIVRVAFLEKSMERYVDIDTRVKNPKKFGGNWL